jgi:16S rRNA (uracil1498-N3)-methyltransferase
LNWGSSNIFVKQDQKLLSLKVIKIRFQVPISLTDYLDSNTNRFGIVLDPKSHFGLKTLSFNADEISILVGPEGGLSNQEMEKAQQNGFSRIGLGPRILRTETAAVTTLAIAQSLWGDLK